MRAVFMDFDGVTHPQPPHSGLQAFCWLPLLRDLVAPYPDVRMVVHSSWRDSMTLEWIVRRAGPAGSLLTDVTPRGERYASILAWLGQHPEVTDYLVLDDMPEEFPRGLSRLIVCDGRTGLSCSRIQGQIRTWLAAIPS